MHQKIKECIAVYIVVVACILWRWIALFAKKCLEWNFYIFVEMRDSMWHAIEFKHSSTITVIMFCINIYIYLIRMSNEKKRNASVRCCIYRYRNRWFALNKIEFPIVYFLQMLARVTLNWPNDCRRTHSFSLDNNEKKKLNSNKNNIIMVRKRKRTKQEKEKKREKRKFEPK